MSIFYLLLRTRLYAILPFIWDGLNKCFCYRRVERINVELNTNKQRPGKRKVAALFIDRVRFSRHKKLFIKEKYLIH